MTAPRFRRLAVYCGAADAALPRYGDLAFAVGRGLAERGIEVVYGGGRVGLMGRVCDGARSVGGEVWGVLPQRLLDLELAHPDCTHLDVVTTMHERKARMAALADGFLALPGGWGTFEEIFEAVTWSQLGYHHKPACLLDHEDFWSGMVAQLDRAAADGFLRPAFRGLLRHATTLDGALAAMAEVTFADIAEVLASAPPAP
jgi:uncharacterized protein (TIGR00730 family)